MGLSPLYVVCGFFYPLGGKHDWSKSMLILGIHMVFPLTQLSGEIINGEDTNLLLN